MRRIAALGAALALLSIPVISTAGEVVLGGDGDDPFIYHIDPFTGREWFRGFLGGNGGVVAMATEPGSVSSDRNWPTRW